MGKPITVLDLAKHRGAKADEDGSFTAGEIIKTGLPFMGGCAVCGATIAAYNACPSKSGYLKCANECIGDSGWDSVEDANRDIFEQRTGSDDDVVDVDHIKFE